MTPFSPLNPLASIIDWAINLATSQQNRRHCFSPPTLCINPNFNTAMWVPTPHTRSREQTTRRSSSSSGARRTSRDTSSSNRPPVVVQYPIAGYLLNRDIHPIYQANVNEPRFPTLDNPTTRPSNPRGVHQRDPHIETPSDNNPRSTFESTEIRAYYPEEIYVSIGLPTCQSHELSHFLESCQNRIVSQAVFNWHYPVASIRQIAYNPLSFANLLWRETITITHRGVVEKYSWIKCRVRPGYPNKAILVHAYDVHYYWGSNSWTVLPALTSCCDSLLIGGSGCTCNKDTGSEGDTLGRWRQ